MRTRTSARFRPGLRLHVGGRVLFGGFPVFDQRQAFVRVARELPAGEGLRGEWTGPGRIQLDVRTEHVGEPAPDERRGVSLRIDRVASAESGLALEQFLRGYLGLESWPDVTVSGAMHYVAFERSEDAHEGIPERKGPPPRVAGVGATAEQAPPLDTGLPATSLELLRTWFESVGSKVGVYLNVPCSYSVAGAQYWGRALRLNDRWLQVNTNSVIPGLGVRMRADLTTEIAGERRPVSLFGVLNRRQDAPPGGMFKATLALRIHRIDEGDSPGLLVAFLQHQRELKMDQEPSA